MIKLGDRDTWNKEKFKVRSHDLMNNDIFIYLQHVKPSMKKFWATVWKDFVIKILFKIVLAKHSFYSANLPKRQEQLYWSKTFYIKFSSNICHLKYLKLSKCQSLSVKYEKSSPYKSCCNLEKNKSPGLHTWSMHLQKEELKGDSSKNTLSGVT